MNNSKIVYVKGEDFFLFDGSSLQKTNPSQAKKYPTALLVPPTALFMYSQKVPSSMDDEQVGIKMDIGMYEDGGAEEEHEYTTGIIRNKLPDEDSDLVDLFGITDKQAKAQYGRIVEQTKTIDYLSPSVAMYKCFYNLDSPELTDMYIYLGEEEAFGVIYLNGNYIAHRNIDTLSRISAQCGWDIDTLKAALKTRGLNDEAYDEAQKHALGIVQASFTRNIERIVHTLNHKQGLFKFEGIDRVFLDFEGGAIPGLESVFANYEVPINVINAVRYPNNKNPLLHHDLLAARYLLGVAQGKYPPINLSPFERDLPIYKQPAGHFLGVALATLLVVFGINFAIGWMIDNKNDDINAVKAKITKLQNSTKQNVKIIKSLEEQQKELDKQYKLLEEEDKSLAKAKKAAPMIQAFALKRQEMMDDSLIGLSKNTLGVLAIDQNGSEMIRLHIVTTPSKQPNIANFMDFMAKRGYKRSFTNNINKKDNLYESTVEIIR